MRLVNPCLYLSLFDTALHRQLETAMSHITESSTSHSAPSIAQAQLSPSRRVPSEVTEYYDALRTFKESFSGDSERELVARAIAQTQVASSSDDRLKLLDVGASDCRNTRKILESTPWGLSGFRLVTIDPDDEALAKTPAEITRWRHFPSQFQELEPDELPTVDVILFSQSLYYFEAPVETLERAMRFLRPRGRIVIAMWDDGCDLRTVANRLAPNLRPPVSGSELFNSAEHIGSCQWHGTWMGGVNFADWRDSQVIASAAVDILSPRKLLLGLPSDERIRRALNGLGSSGIRKNVVFSFDKA